MSQPLIEALQNPELYPHPVERFDVIETHISWVVLTGEFAYKLKKPANFGFLDFTTVESRRHFCEEELRLNQRMTKGLYLEVVPISGSEEQPRLGDGSAPFEYALKMRQFPQEQMLGALQARGELTTSHIDVLAQRIADFHQRTPAVAADHPLCSAEAIVAPMRQNFEQIRPLLTEGADLEQLAALEAWTESSIERLWSILQSRAGQGAIRECHGDLHLGNATLIDGEPVLFDCIEFNEPFRLIDRAVDAAFLAMDLEDRGLKAFSRRFTDLWFERSGDYEALPLWSLYKAYRALVRAKVNLFRLGQETDAVQRAVVLREYRRYAALAEGYSAIPSRFLIVTHGVSAVGKSQVAMRLVESLGAIRLRADVERKRLFASADNASLYSREASIATYGRLHELAKMALQSGFPAVIDATYLRRADRKDASAIAEASGVAYLILDCEAPEAVIAEWLAQRQADGLDPSDATLEVIAQQRIDSEALDEEEALQSCRVNTHEPASVDGVIDRIRQQLPGL